MPGRKKAKRYYCFPLWVEKLDNGYWAMCPALPTCFARGLTYEETLTNISLVIQGKLDEVVESGAVIRPAAAYSFAVVEVQG